MIRFTRNNNFVGGKIPIYVKSYQTNKLYGPIYKDESIEVDECGGSFELYMKSVIAKHMFGNIIINAPQNSDSAFILSSTGGGNFGEVVAHLSWSTPKEAIGDKSIFNVSNEEPKYAIGSGSFNQSLVCSDCERVVFIGKRLGNIAEIDPDQIAKLDSIEINGHRFEVVK